MAHAQQQIESPTAGQAITFLQTAAETDGEVLVMEAVLAPGARVPLHVHPAQEERFIVEEGRPFFRVGNAPVRAEPGQMLVAPRYVPHRFHNDTAARVRLHVELRPALRTAELFEALFALDRAGRLNRFGAPNPRVTATLAREHGDGFFWLGRIPIALQRALLAPLAWRS